MKKKLLINLVLFSFLKIFLTSTNNIYSNYINDYLQIKTQLEKKLGITFLAKDNQSDLSFDIGRLDAQKLYCLQNLSHTRVLSPLDNLTPEVIALILSKATINSNEKVKYDANGGGTKQSRRQFP